MYLSVAVTPIGSSRNAHGTLHFSSSAIAAGWDAKCPSASVATLSPLLVICSTVAPPLGYIS